MLKIFKVFKKKVVMSVVSMLVVSGGLMIAPNKVVHADAVAESAVKADNVHGKSREVFKKFVNDLKDKKELQAEFLDFSKEASQVMGCLKDATSSLNESLKDVKVENRLGLFAESSQLKQQAKDLGEDIELSNRGELNETKEQALNTARQRIKDINMSVDALKDGIEKTGLGSSVKVPKCLEELPENVNAISDETSVKLKEDAKSLGQFADNFMQEIKNFDYDKLRDCYRRILGLSSEYRLLGEKSEFAVSKMDLPDQNQSIVSMVYTAKKDDEIIGNLNGKNKLRLEVVDLKTNGIVLSNDVLVMDMDNGLFKQFEDLGRSLLQESSGKVKERESKKYDKAVFTLGVIDKVDLNGEYKLNLIDKSNNSVVESVNVNFDLKPISEQYKNELSNVFVDSIKCQFDIIENMFNDGLLDKVLPGGFSAAVIKI